MIRSTGRICGITLGFLAAWSSATAAEPDDSATWNTEFRFGGVGGVYFLASPGELWVEV